MKFKIEAVSVWEYHKLDKFKKLIERYPCLNDIGFEIEKYITNEGVLYYEAFVHIDSLDQLLELSKQVDEELIIHHNFGEPRIEIYDGHRE